jgi:O-antigen ligase
MHLTINSKSLSGCLASWGLLLLFPGFFLYHLLLAMGVISPLLGGFFGPVSLVYFIIFLISLPFTYQRLLNICPVFYVSTILFFIFCSCWILVHYYIIDELYIRDASIQALSTLIIWGALFFIGIHFSFEFKTIKTFFILMFMAIFLGLIYFSISTGNIMFYAIQFYELEEEGSGVVSYQGFARSALVISILLLCFINDIYLRYIIIIASIFVLFFLGSRSDLYAFIFFVVLFLMVLSIINIKWLFLVIGGLIAIAIFVSFNLEWLNTSRQFELMDLSQSTSWLGRKDLQDIALRQIADSPLFGYFGGDIVDTGGIGRYVHNVLSAWVTYGLFGFLLYTTLIIVATLRSFFYFVKDRTLSPHWTFAFAINFYCLLLIIMSQPIYWIMPALGWGLYVNAMALHKNATVSLSC